MVSLSVALHTSQCPPLQIQWDDTFSVSARLKKEGLENTCSLKEVIIYQAGINWFFTIHQ